MYLLRRLLHPAVHALYSTGTPPFLNALADARIAGVKLEFSHAGFRFGRAMVAIHEDDLAAEATGINLTRTKLLSFSLGAMVAGVAGGFYAHQALFIDANQFDFSRSATTFLYVVLGGVSNPLGSIVGAAIVTLLPEVLRVVQDWRMTVFGTMLVLIAVWRPDGLLRAPRLHKS